MTETPIFKNQKVKKELQEKGYAVINLLDDDEVNSFLSKWKEIAPASIQGNYCSILNTDVSFNEKVNKIVYDLFNEKLNSIFQNIYPILVGSVLIKEASSDAVVSPHMDPTLVDESMFSTYNVWIPMIDVDDKNGCLYMFNDYHFAKTYFSKRPCNYDAANPLEFADIDFWGNSTPICMKAGQALIFDHKMPHGSKGNFSSFNRIAASLGIVPQDADLLIYYQNKTMHNCNQIEKYTVEYTSYYSRNEKGIPIHYLKKNLIQQYPKIFFFKKKLKKYFSNLLKR